MIDSMKNIHEQGDQWSDTEAHDVVSQQLEQRRIDLETLNAAKKRLGDLRIEKLGLENITNPEEVISKKLEAVKAEIEKVIGIIEDLGGVVEEM